MSAIYLGETVMRVIRLLNSSPTKALDNKMSYKAWHGRKRMVGHLCVFGRLAFAKELNHVSKLDDQSTPGFFIGYAEGVKAYHILGLVTQHVHVSHDVMFDEGRGWT
jgi:hypothetical protein